VSLSNYLEQKLVDLITNNGTFTSPATLYVKLHLGDPGEDCTSNVAVNSTRKLVTFGAWAAGVANGLGTPVAEWVAVSTTETYTHFSVFDHLTVGNPLGSGALGSAAAVTAGQTFQLTALTWAID